MVEPSIWKKTCLSESGSFPATFTEYLKPPHRWVTLTNKQIYFEERAGTWKKCIESKHGWILFCRANVGPYISIHVFLERAEIILHGYQKPVCRGEKTHDHIRIELRTLMIYRRVSGTSQKNRSKTSYMEARFLKAISWKPFCFSFFHHRSYMLMYDIWKLIMFLLML